MSLAVQDFQYLCLLIKIVTCAFPHALPQNWQITPRTHACPLVNPFRTLMGIKKKGNAWRSVREVGDMMMMEMGLVSVLKDAH